MNEKEKAEAKQGTGGFQRKESSVEKEIRACDEEEARLFAQRGHGGYIKTEDLEAIRKRKSDAIGNSKAAER